jgi:hypothetical protein
MDAFDGYVSYRLLDEKALAPEIAEMRALIDRQYSTLDIDQDLGLGMMLWLACFFPQENWAKVQTRRAIAALDRLWIDPPGFFGRATHARLIRIAFANYGVALGLQAVDRWPERVDRLNNYFERYRSGDEYRSRGDHPRHGVHRAPAGQVPRELRPMRPFLQKEAGRERKETTAASRNGGVAPR